MSYRVRSQPLAGAMAFVALSALLAAWPPQTSPAEASCSDIIDNFQRGGEISSFYRCALERVKTFNPPRTPDGKPDLQGMWMRTHTAESIEEREAVPGLSPHQRTMIVDPPDGKIPYQPWALEVKKPFRDKVISPTTWCGLAGPKFTYWGNSGDTQIIQTPAYVALFQERFHEHRIIPIDGPPPLGKDIKMWNGDARGRWEGNTLIVTLANFNGLSVFDHDINFATPDLRMTEHFSLVSADMLLWEAIVEAPNVFTRPWKMVMPFVRNKDPRFEFLEEACHEDILDLHNFFDQGQDIFRGVTPPK